MAIFSGKADSVAHPEDVDWLAEQLGDNLRQYRQIEGGHVAPLIGKNMQYFKGDVIRLLHRYHPLWQTIIHEQEDTDLKVDILL